MLKTAGASFRPSSFEYFTFQSFEFVSNYEFRTSNFLPGFELRTFFLVSDFELSSLLEFAFGRYKTLWENSTTKPSNAAVATPTWNEKKPPCWKRANRPQFPVPQSGSRRLRQPPLLPPPEPTALLAPSVAFAAWGLIIFSQD